MRSNDLLLDAILSSDRPDPVASALREIPRARRKRHVTRSLFATAVLAIGAMMTWTWLPSREVATPASHIALSVGQFSTGPGMITTFRTSEVKLCAIREINDEMLFALLESYNPVISRNPLDGSVELRLLRAGP